MDYTQCEKLILDFKNQNIIVIGDIMLDKYLYTTVDRICPEAPVPVAKFTHQETTLGGAANVARNIKSLGGNVKLFSIAGEDEPLDEIIQHLECDNIEYEIFTVDGKQTTEKIRICAKDKLLLRLDYEDDKTFDSTDQIIGFANLINEYAIENSVKYIILSDYDKGIFSDIFLYELIHFICLQPYTNNNPIKLLCDLKPKNFNVFNDLFLLKPNKKEVYDWCKINFGHSNFDIQTVVNMIKETCNIENILVTLGEDGMFLSSHDRDINENIETSVTSIAKKVYDVSGAGDTVMATLALCLSSGADLIHSSLISNIAAGICVEKFGVSCVEPNELLNTIKNNIQDKL